MTIEKSSKLGIKAPGLDTNGNTDVTKFGGVFNKVLNKCFAQNKNEDKSACVSKDYVTFVKMDHYSSKNPKALIGRSTIAAKVTLGNEYHHITINYTDKLIRREAYRSYKDGTKLTLVYQEIKKTDGTYEITMGYTARNQSGKIIEQHTTKAKQDYSFKNNGEKIKAVRSQRDIALAKFEAKHSGQPVAIRVEKALT